ncbi:short-chain dehydrogenase TIC 32 B, chloroplastic-like isoform X1 [Syzygium oleosum]|uniref:short-chain dehydrogenase TIC 32 B, chloroplastic-like isoform X1 n=1 Tax=Syzygium oleosum TaxID=219896 RepID=UPI0011D1D64E|nr:short-chain dehydrogenase TIC 32 B, chloroplastic-like isoform X1 [Syzygium oleosum]
MSIFSLVTGRRGPSGFGSAATAEQVTEGIDASNVTAIVTGGGSGIGFETARVLALRGAHVIIAARDTDAANAAKRLILNNDGDARVDVLKLDLCSMKSIRSFVDNFIALDLPLNILINNAGIMFCPFQLSEDGFEVQFATNHLGHFLLTNLLLDKMKATARVSGIEGRIVNLSSIAHLHTYQEGIRFDDINDELSYSDKKAYGQSKLANILHANELSRRLQQEGANITVNSLHPGLIMTNLMRHSFIAARIFRMFTYLLWKNVPQGAATTCYIALHPSLKGVTGKYFMECNETEPSALARDEHLAKKLWDFSNELVDSASKG